MPRYRTRSWRAFDPAAHAARAVAPTATAAATAAVVATASARTTVVRLTPDRNVRILGIDPGSQRTGYGVIECGGANSTSLVHGCIAVQGASLNDRLRRIFEGMQALIERFQPDEVAIERVFVNRNVDSALKLGHARGAALCAVPAAMPVFEYTPRAVKLAIVGFGGAEKVQVAHMIRRLLTLQGKLSSDASDALAVAICHAHSRRVDALARSAGITVAIGGAAAGRAR
jgi:crossover junction endodeoxyribonuclease RuvC